MDSFSWCPGCRYWVPGDQMNYDIDPDTNKLTRICCNCLEDTEVFSTKDLVLETHHEDTQCIMCDSYNTKEIEKRGIYICNECGERFTQ